MSTKINSTNEGGKKPYTHLLPFMALVLFGLIALMGVAAADNVLHGAPPVTKVSSAINGTVNGGVDVLMSKDPWNATASEAPYYYTSRGPQYSWGNLTLAVRPDLVDMKFARLYVVVYGGSMIDSYTGNVSVGLYKENMTGANTYMGTLVNAQPLDLTYDNSSATYNTSVSWPLINLSRTTSDYILVFDIKDSIANLDTNKINVNITSFNSTGKFDGRIKTVQLAYGWDWEEAEQSYWVNEGNDPMSKYVSSTTYNTTSFSSTGMTDATLWVDYIASTDGIYKWNTNSITPTTLYQGKYAGLNRGSVTTTDSDSLGYARGSTTYYKINFAVLSQKQ
jgi:hypothetical protein